MVYKKKAYYNKPPICTFAPGTVLYEIRCPNGHETPRQTTVQWNEKCHCGEATRACNVRWWDFTKDLSNQ